jgi:hypothetical protein
MVEKLVVIFNGAAVSLAPAGLPQTPLFVDDLDLFVDHLPGKSVDGDV